MLELPGPDFDPLSGNRGIHCSCDTGRHVALWRQLSACSGTDLQLDADRTDVYRSRPFSVTRCHDPAAALARAPGQSRRRILRHSFGGHRCGGGYLSLWIVYHLYRIITGRAGFGHGDFKLLAALGAWLGWQMLPLIILLASVVGAAVGICMITAGRLNSRQPLPFGPYLAGAGLIAMLFGQQLVNGYLRFTGLG